MSRIHRITTALAVFALAAVASAPVHAQSATSDSMIVALDGSPASVPSAVVSSPAPSAVVASPVALRAVVSTDVPSPPMYREKTSRSVALMVVGGAALIVGSIVDGDSGTIIMVGGAVIGLYGLWTYLK